MKHIPIFFFVPFLWLLTGCPSPVPSKSPFPEPNNPENLPVEEDPSLFVYDGAAEEYVFSVNDGASSETGGSTYWIEREIPSDSFTPIEIMARKTSGFNGGGFGLLFGQRAGDTDNFSCLVLMINVLGEYCIGLVEEQQFNFIKGWTSSGSLVTGYSQDNVIRIENHLTPGRYNLYFNGTLIDNFEDPSDIVHSGGGYGYVAVVTPVEDFPAVPVMVKFMED